MADQKRVRPLFKMYFRLNFDFKVPKALTLQSMPEGISDEDLGNDVDWDGITDDMDFICNGCGPDGASLIGVDGEGGTWAVIDEDLVDTYQNGTDEQRDAIFDYYNSDLNSIESEDETTDDSD